MSVPIRLTQMQCQLLAHAATDEILKICLEEGGSLEAIRALAVLLHGEFLPGPVIVRLEREAAKIRRKVRVGIA
jgi:hypothetical protein